MAAVGLTEGGIPMLNCPKCGGCDCHEMKGGKEVMAVCLDCGTGKPIKEFMRHHKHPRVEPTQDYDEQPYPYRLEGGM